MASKLLAFYCVVALLDRKEGCTCQTVRVVGFVEFVMFIKASIQVWGEREEFKIMSVN